MTALLIILFILLFYITYSYSRLECILNTTIESRNPLNIKIENMTNSRSKTSSEPDRPLSREEMVEYVHVPDWFNTDTVEEIYYGLKRQKMINLHNTDHEYLTS